jgi:hypothetical protein
MPRRIVAYWRQTVVEHHINKESVVFPSLCSTPVFSERGDCAVLFKCLCFKALLVMLHSILHFLFFLFEILGSFYVDKNILSIWSVAPVTCCRAPYNSWHKYNPPPLGHGMLGAPLCSSLISVPYKWVFVYRVMNRQQTLTDASAGICTSLTMIFVTHSQ